MLAKLMRPGPVVFLALLLIATPFAMPAVSNSAGAPVQALDGGCTCHGAAASAVTASLAGPPEYEGNKTYSLTLNINGGPTNLPVVSQNRGGFAIKVSVGTFRESPDAQHLLEGKGLTHTVAGNDKRSWTIEWMSPAVAEEPAVFTFYGNAVDGTGTTQLDQWNRGTLTIPPMRADNATANETQAPGRDSPFLPLGATLVVVLLVAACWRRR